MTGWLAGFGAVCAAGPAGMFWANLRLYQPPLPGDAGAHLSDDETVAKMGHPGLAAVSVLIPARNEAAGIADCLASVLASTGVELEVIVMDDASTDGTVEVVEAIAARDGRVRVERAPALPAGWNGKQHACWALARAARFEVMCFVDADVRLEPECLGRMAGFLEGKGLVSGFPRQVTGTWMEWMLLPLIHFVLLGFLPLGRMRAGTEPAYAAGCGQFLMVERKAYFASGGHAGIRATMHDGLLLPRAFRAHGFRTDLADLTGLATCRMYSTARQVWDGLAKNATEGIADARRIVPVSVVLFVGQVLPFLLVFWTRWAWVGVAAAWLPRMMGVRRFRQDWRGALLHPFGILILLAIQWYALGRKMMGGSVSWKARAYVKD